MHLKLVAKDSKTGGCPAVYATSDGKHYVVQGPEFTDAEGLHDTSDIAPGERFVVIPRELLRHLAANPEG